MTDRTRHFQDVSRLSQAALRANDAAKEVIYTMTDTPTPEQTALGPQCCMCGMIGLSKVEDDGGDECQLEDGRWTCSDACYCKAVYAPDGDFSGALAGYREMKELRGVLSSSRDCIKAASSQLTKKHAKALEGKIWGWWYLDQIDTALAAIAKAQGGPNVIPLQMEARRDRIRAEKAEAEVARLLEAIADTPERSRIEELKHQADRDTDRIHELSDEVERLRDANAALRAALNKGEE